MTTEEVFYGLSEDIEKLGMCLITSSTGLDYFSIANERIRNMLITGPHDANINIYELIASMWIRELQVLACDTRSARASLADVRDFTGFKTALSIYVIPLYNKM